MSIMCKTDVCDMCCEQELVHSRQQLNDDRAHTQTAVDNLKHCLRLMQWSSALSAYCS